MRVFNEEAFINETLHEIVIAAEGHWFQSWDVSTVGAFTRNQKPSLWLPTLRCININFCQLLDFCKTVRKLPQRNSSYHRIWWLVEMLHATQQKRSWDALTFDRTSHNGKVARNLEPSRNAKPERRVVKSDHSRQLIVTHFIRIHMERINYWIFTIADRQMYTSQS